MADDELLDVIVIGAGIAGSVCAYQLAKAGHQVAVLERGAAPGAKNLSGGVFYCRVMDHVFPGFAQTAPVERRIVRNRVGFMNERSLVSLDYWDARLGSPTNAVTVRRASLDAWLAEQSEQAGAIVMPGVRVDSLITDGAQVTGVRAGEDEMRARLVIAADGVSSFISQAAGLRNRAPEEQLALGVKSVIALPAEAIAQRFQLSGDEGAAYTFVGDATQGIAGGGFMYTNTASISVGVVLRLDDLKRSGRSSSEVHDHLLEHPAIAPYIAGGELMEYGCHLIAEGGKAMQHDLTRPGLMVIGDAAGFTLNTGLTIRGMDLAAQSAISAAAAADRALSEHDFSQVAMDRYPAHYERTFLGADMDTYARMPRLLENRRVYASYGPLLAELLHDVYNLDTTPRRHLRATARKALRSSRISPRSLAQDAIDAIRLL